MNKLKVIIWYLMYICCIPLSVNAQTPILTKVFDFSTSPLNDGYQKMNQLPESYGFSGWDFNDHCWAMENNNLQLGSTSGNVFLPGLLKTPKLNLNGNAVVLLHVKGHSTDNASFKLYAVSETAETTSDVSQFTINSKSNEYLSAYIKDGGTDTRINIEGVSGKFSLVSICVITSDEGFFHEGFGNMSANKEFDIINNSASADHCDNTNSLLSGIWQSEKCIYFPSSTSGNYTTPELSLHPNRRYYLFFNIAEDNNSNHPTFTLNCNNGCIISFGTVNLNESTTSYQTTINVGKNLQFKQFYAIIEGKETTQVTFGGNSFFLDDVFIMPKMILIDENQNNNNTINEYIGLSTVTLNRTLGEGYWNTLCLPFDITQESFAKETGTTAKIRTLGSVTDGVFHFNKMATDATIKAGTPFIVKVSQDVVNPQFGNVLIQNVAAKTISVDGASNYKFVGTYSPITLATNKTNLFLGTDGKLYYPSSNSVSVSTMKGLRAYFIVPDGAVNSRVSINGEEMDAISNIDVETNIDAPIYDLRGQRHNANTLHKGIYIRDGRKVIVK